MDDDDLANIVLLLRTAVATGVNPLITRCPVCQRPAYSGCISTTAAPAITPRSPHTARCDQAFFTTQAHALMKAARAQSCPAYLVLDATAYGCALTLTSPHDEGHSSVIPAAPPHPPYRLQWHTVNGETHVARTQILPPF
jgi:hypothetical protein